MFATCYRWQVTRDTIHMTYDNWHMTHDMQHLTCDTWHVKSNMWWVYFFLFFFSLFLAFSGRFGVMIRTRQKIQCLPYAGFLWKLLKPYDTLPHASPRFILVSPVHGREGRNSTFSLRPMAAQNRHCTLWATHCTVQSLYTVCYTLFTVQLILYTVHCTLYTVHSTLYSIRDWMVVSCGVKL